MTPASLPLPSITPRQPNDFCVMVTSAALIGVFSPTSGSCSPVCITSATNLSAAPSEPPGWNTLKSCAVKPLCSSRAMARQSPMRELHGGRGGGRQAVRAGFLGARQLQHHVGLLGQRRVGARGDGDQRHLEAARVGQDIAELDALARPGHGHDGVVARDHAEVAVAGLARMHEEGRRAGRGEGGGELLATCPLLPMPVTITRPLAAASVATALAEGRAQLLVERAPQSSAGPRIRDRACVRPNSARPHAVRAPVGTTRNLRLAADAGMRAALVGAGRSLCRRCRANRSTVQPLPKAPAPRTGAQRISAQIPGNHNHPFGCRA